MKRLVLFVFASLLSLFSGQASSQTHNIKTSIIVAPAPNSRVPINIPDSIAFRFTNLGSVDEVSVPVAAIVRDSSGVEYRDTLIIPVLSVGQDLDTSFRYWVPRTLGAHSIMGIALLPNDADRSNDTLSVNVDVEHTYDAKAVALINPTPGENKAIGSRWQPIATFESIGVLDLFDVMARVTIHRCADSVLVFQADSLIPELNISDGPVRFVFPSRQGPWDITNLHPGCYYLGAIVRHSHDENRKNDTVWTTFSVGASGVESDAEEGSAVSLTCFPNPVTKVAMLSLHTTAPGPVELRVYDLLGTQLAILHAGELAAGEFNFGWDANRYPAGTYICRIRTAHGEKSIAIQVLQ